MSSILLRGSSWLHNWKTPQLLLHKPAFGKVAMGTFFQKEVIKYFSSFNISGFFFTYFILTFFFSVS